MAVYVTNMMFCRSIIEPATEDDYRTFIGTMGVYVVMHEAGIDTPYIIDSTLFLTVCVDEKKPFRLSIDAIDPEGRETLDWMWLDVVAWRSSDRRKHSADLRFDLRERPIQVREHGIYHLRLRVAGDEIARASFPIVSPFDDPG